MPWVALEESGVPFTFAGGFQPAVTTLVDSVASFADAPYGGEWSVTFESVQDIRITTQQYSSSYDPAQDYSYFYWTGGQQLNTAAAGFPGPGDVTAFTPTPFEIAAVTIFNYGFEGSGHSNNIETYAFLIEVWEEPPPVPPAPEPCTEIGRVSRAYVSAHDRTRVHSTRLYPREKRCLVANFNGAIPAGRTIVTATWEMEVASSVSIASPSIVGRTAQVMIQACYRGMVGMRCQVVLDNGEIYNQLFVVQVLDGPYFGDEATAPGPTQVSVSV